MAVKPGRRRIFFVSPIPPVRTGPADYMRDFLCAVPGDYRERYELSVVCDPRDYDRIPSDCEGCAVIPYTKVTERPTDIFVYFIANNRWHRYAYRMLVDHVRGTPYAVLHDIQCTMGVLSMCVESDCGFGPADLPKFFASEVGGGAVAWAQRFLGGEMPYLATYLGLAQSIPVERARAIVVHSHYGKLKLLAERFPGCAVPPVLVLQMPQAPHAGDPAWAGTPSGLPTSAAAPRGMQDKFRIGVFGLISPHKRTLQVMMALRRYLDGIPESQRAAIRLDLAGPAWPPGGEYFTSVVDYVRNNDLMEHVTAHGYVARDEMNRMMNEAHLIFNLRFPSCGESSATLTHLMAVPGIVVTSDYAAMHEEPMEFKTSVGRVEIDDIVETIRLAHRAFLNNIDEAEGKRESRVGMAKGGLYKLSVSELMDTFVSEPTVSR